MVQALVTLRLGKIFTEISMSVLAHWVECFKMSNVRTLQML
jgi:hypothetical protein